MLFRTLIGTLLLSLALQSQSQTLLGSFTWSVNGHTYEAWGEPNGISYTDAASFAGGRGGTLATFTSIEENAAVIDNLGGVMATTSYLGGTQPLTETDPSANWSWVTGEAWSFTNWNGGEPNDFYGPASEQFLEVYANGSWNDIVENGTGYNTGFLVEIVPEPSSLILVGLTGLALRKRSSKRS